MGLAPPSSVGANRANTKHVWAVLVLVLACALLGNSLAGSGPAIVSVYPVANASGLMVTTGGWAYCLQLQALARHEHYTLACGRYWKDGTQPLSPHSPRRRPAGAAWITHSKRGHDLWDRGRAIIAGHPPGHEISFPPDGHIPAGAICS